MNDAQNLNLSLLSQNEIDTLVNFLLEKKSTVDSSVLSQSSIDKLIELIRYDNSLRRQELIPSVAHVSENQLGQMGIRQNKEELCELRCETDGDTGFLQIVVYNTTTEQSMLLTPSSLTGEDSEGWGFCISPSLFCRLARALGAKYSAQTYDLVCDRFAKCVFGSEDHKIPVLYLPEQEVILDCML